MAKVGVFLKKMWNEQPVIVAACAVGLASLCTAVLGPHTFTYTVMMYEAMPYKYPVPLRDDGNMPDVPAHPCEPKGRSLEWLKNM